MANFSIITRGSGDNCRPRGQGCVANGSASLSTLPPSRQEPPFRRGGIRPRSPAEMLEPSRPPGPPRGAAPPGASRRGGGFMRFVSGLFTLLLFLMLAAGGMAALLYHQFETPGPLAVSRVIVVPKGEGRIAIATRLEKEGAISNRWAFIANYLHTRRRRAQAAGAQGRRLRDQEERQHGGHHGDADAGARRALQAHHPRGTDQPADRREAARGRRAGRRHHRYPAGGGAAARYLPLLQGHGPARAARPHAGRDAALPRHRMGASPAEPAHRHARGSHHLRLHRREGNRARR